MDHPTPATTPESTPDTARRRLLTQGAAVAGLSALGVPALVSAQADKIKIGHLTPMTGFLGALTTFSSFSAEVVNLLMHQRYALALGTAGLHLVGSLLLTVAGIWSVQHLLSFQ